MGKHIEIRIKTNPLWSEYISDLLINRVGCSGVVTEEKEFKDEQVTRADIETVKGYLPYIKNFDAGAIQKVLFDDWENLVSTGVNPDYMGSWTLTAREIKEEEWAENWKKFWHPQKIGKKTVICPTWEDYEPGQGEIVIKLDPGSAFGTGTHPTTRLCVQALESVIPEFNRKITMADVGTGSGILAIAGIKLGVSHAIGVDNDPSVISVAEENAGKNNISDKCEFYTGSAVDIKGKFDIVTANILTEVLVEIMPDLKKLLNPDGILILSGIIKRKQPLIEESLENSGLKIREIPEEGEWIAPVNIALSAVRF